MKNPQNLKNSHFWSSTSRQKQWMLIQGVTTALVLHCRSWLASFSVSPCSIPFYSLLSAFTIPSRLFGHLRTIGCLFVCRTPSSSSFPSLPFFSRPFYYFVPLVYPSDIFPIFLLSHFPPSAHSFFHSFTTTSHHPTPASGPGPRSPSRFHFPLPPRPYTVPVILLVPFSGLVYIY